MLFIFNPMNLGLDLNWFHWKKYLNYYLLDFIRQTMAKAVYRQSNVNQMNLTIRSMANDQHHLLSIIINSRIVLHYRRWRNAALAWLTKRNVSNVWSWATTMMVTMRKVCVQQWWWLIIIYVHRSSRICICRRICTEHIAQSAQRSSYRFVFSS